MAKSKNDSVNVQDSEEEIGRYATETFIKDYLYAEPEGVVSGIMVDEDTGEYSFDASEVKSTIEDVARLCTRKMKGKNYDELPDEAKSKTELSKDKMISAARQKLVQANKYLKDNPKRVPNPLDIFNKASNIRYLNNLKDFPLQSQARSGRTIREDFSFDSAESALQRAREQHKKYLESQKS